MKKKAIIIITIVVIIAALLIGAGVAIYLEAQNNTEISQEKAASIALADANVAESDTRRLTSHLELDDGYKYYDVYFRSGDFEYEYEIDATTGEILKKEKDREIF